MVLQMIPQMSTQINSSESVVSLSGEGGPQLANLVALPSPGNMTMAELQQNGVTGFTSLSLGESGQQVLVVTDPSQLEALQVNFLQYFLIFKRITALI